MDRFHFTCEHCSLYSADQKTSNFGMDAVIYSAPPVHVDSARTPRSPSVSVQSPSQSVWTLQNNCIKWETYLFLFNMGHMIYVLDQFFSVNSMGVSIFRSD